MAALNVGVRRDSGRPRARSPVADSYKKPWDENTAQRRPERVDIPILYRDYASSPSANRPPGQPVSEGGVEAIEVAVGEPGLYGECLLEASSLTLKVR